METVETTYKEYCNLFNQIEKHLRKYSKPTDKVLTEICYTRGYYPERMEDILRKAGFFYIEDLTCVEPLRKYNKTLHLFGDTGRFLLEGRYIFPVRDMLGNTIALIGWFPDEKKYVTTPSRFFSKDKLFYGLEQLGKTGIGKSYFLVEGIFDCLTLRSLGFNCIAQMGITTSRYKQSLYALFGRLTAIPDNDVEGRQVISGDKWKLVSNGKYFRWVGDKSKDIDELCNRYEAEDVIELLKEVEKEDERVVTRRV